MILLNKLTDSITRLRDMDMNDQLKLNHKKIVASARKMMEDNPKLTKTKIAPTLGISDSFLCRLLKRYPEEPTAEKVETRLKDSHKRVVAALTAEMKNQGYEEEEIAKGYAFIEGEHYIAIPFEVRIPAGLTDGKRKSAIHSILAKQLKHVEIVE